MSRAFGSEDVTIWVLSLWVVSGRMRGAKRLLQLPPLSLGVGYLLLIPLFATVYWLLPHGSFYDSNAEREKGVYGDAAKLRGSLSSAVQRHLDNLRVAIEGVNVAIKPRTVAISSLQYTPEHRLLMEITGRYGPAERSNFAVGNFAFWVETSVSEGASPPDSQATHWPSPCRWHLALRVAAQMKNPSPARCLRRSRFCFRPRPRPCRCPRPHRGL